MLKYRLIFGSIMAAVLLFVLWLDSRIVAEFANGAKVTGFLVSILLVLVAFPAVLELRGLAKQKNAQVFTGVVVTGAGLLSLAWFFRQFLCKDDIACGDLQLYYMLVVLVASFLGILVYQARTNGTEGTIVNCSVSMFGVLYLGLLGGFLLGIRLEYGFWAFLMFIITVKSSDIGAYTVGRIFGKHKFAPRISPGKTWEGMAGACLFAGLVGLAFSFSVELVGPFMGILFGAVFAFIGQLGDLAESMLKRDAQMKDSASKIPGFGGVLDVIDSPLVAAPFGYMFFRLIEAFG